MSKRKARTEPSLVDGFLAQALDHFQNNAHSQYFSKNMMVAQEHESMKQMFKHHAGKMPWVKFQSNKADRRPSFETGHGSRHCNGTCVNSLLNELNITLGTTSSQLVASFLLFMDVNDDMTLHVDPCKSLKNTSKLPKNTTDDPAFAKEVLDTYDAGQWTIECVRVHAGDLICFRGNRPHAVWNEESSFSFGLHYASPLFENDEFVVYGILSGVKHLMFLRCNSEGAQIMEAYVSSLGIRTTKELCMPTSSYAAFRTSFFCHTLADSFALHCGSEECDLCDCREWIREFPQAHLASRYDDLYSQTAEMLHRRATAVDHFTSRTHDGMAIECYRLQCGKPLFRFLSDNGEYLWVHDIRLTE